MPGSSWAQRFREDEWFRWEQLDLGRDEDYATDILSRIVRIKPGEDASWRRDMRFRASEMPRRQWKPLTAEMQEKVEARGKGKTGGTAGGNSAGKGAFAATLASSAWSASGANPEASSVHIEFDIDVRVLIGAALLAARSRAPVLLPLAQNIQERPRGNPRREHDS